jgi:hypothetical protein
MQERECPKRGIPLRRRKSGEEMFGSQPGLYPFGNPLVFLQVFIEPDHATTPSFLGRFGPVAGAVIGIKSVGGVFVSIGVTY